MDKLTKLSEAIRFGSTFVEECQTFQGCALGTAYRAIHPEVEPSLPDFKGGFVIMQELSLRFDVPVETLEQVSRDHFRGGKDRAQCADWLEARGY